MLLLIGLTRAEIRAHLSNRQSDGKENPRKSATFPTTPQQYAARLDPTRRRSHSRAVPELSPFSATSATRSSVRSTRAAGLVYEGKQHGPAAS